MSNGGDIQSDTSIVTLPITGMCVSVTVSLCVYVPLCVCTALLKILVVLSSIILLTMTRQLHLHVTPHITLIIKGEP